MPTPRDFAPGPGWRPPGELVSKSGRDSTADYLNAIAGVAARANNFDLGTPGVHFGHAFHPTPNIQAQSRSFTALMIEDLSPGTWDDPEVSPAYLMLREQKSGPLKASEQIISVVSYSSSVSAASGTTAIGYVDTDGTYVAESGGGGGSGGKIWFDVIAIGYYNGWVLPGCESVLAVVTQVSCETTAAAVGDEVYIYDPSFCFFNLPIVILMNLSGTATLSKRDDLTFVRCGVDMPDACFWAVDGVCCLEEDYGT